MTEGKGSEREKQQVRKMRVQGTEALITERKGSELEKRQVRV